MVVIKRDGRKVDFQGDKISNAIQKAMLTETGKRGEKISDKIALEIEEELLEQGVDSVEIKTIESLVYEKLIKYKKSKVAKAYESYRAVGEYQRNCNSID